MGSLPNQSIMKGEQRPYKPNFLHRIFEEVVREKNDSDVALMYQDENSKAVTKHTYKELDSITNRLSRSLLMQIKDNCLKANGDGDFIIAVSMPPSDKLVIALLSIWKAGAAYVPLDPSFPEKRVRHILQEAGPVIVIHQNTENVESTFKGTYSISYEDLLQASEPLPSNPIPEEDCVRHARDDLAIVLYTSGSTGIPKGVRLPHKTILNRLQWQWRTFPFSDTEHTGVFKTSLTFVDSASEIWGPLLTGRAVLVVPKSVTQDPERLVHLLTDYKIERLVLVPSLLRSILLYLRLQSNKDYLADLRTWVCSGESLPVALAEEFFDYFSDSNSILCNFYGSTEIMGDVSYYVINNKEQLAEQTKVPIGKAIDNTILYLLDSELKPVDIGSTGELYVAGYNLAAGYVNGRDPDKFIENPLTVDPGYAQLFKTGDFARIEKGTLQYEGRTDSQVKVRGHRVDLSEVERALVSSPDIEKGVVLCYKPGELEQALLAFVTTRPDTKLTGLQIESNLLSALPAYMVPQVVTVDKIPLLVNGKVDRQTLLKMYENTNNNDDTTITLDIDYSDIPTDKMDAAKILLETVGSVIGRSTRSTLSIKSNFYHLGGNSLNSVFTVTKLRDFGYFIGITDFITAANMGDILDKMILNTNKTDLTCENERLMSNYTVEPLAEKHKTETFEIITNSFYEKADLEQWLMPYIYKSDYSELMEKMWKPLLEKDLSFVMRSKNGDFIGVALNFDARDEPDIHINSKLAIVFDFLEYVEGPIRDNKLPKGKGKIFHCSMMATKSSLTAQENVSVMQAMEEAVIRIAKKKGFSGIFTTNTSPLTQQLATDVYGYQVMLDYQVNKYMATDKSKPFGRAPDSQRAVVAWKPI